MKKTIVILLCLIMVLSIPVFAAKAAKGTGKMPGKMYMHKNMMDNLDLTKDQMAKIEALREKLKKDNKNLIAKKKKLNKELRALMKADDLNIGRIEGKMKDIANIKTKIAINRLKKKKEMKKMLTEKQKDQMKEMKEERMKKRKEMMKEKIEKMKKMMDEGDMPMEGRGMMMGE